MFDKRVKTQNLAGPGRIPISNQEAANADLAEREQIQSALSSQAGPTTALAVPKVDGWEADQCSARGGEIDSPMIGPGIETRDQIPPSEQELQMGNAVGFVHCQPLGPCGPIQLEAQLPRARDVLQPAPTSDEDKALQRDPRADPSVVLTGCVDGDHASLPLVSGP